MHNKYARDANYPLTVQPAAGDNNWTVKNLESGVDHGTFPSIQKATEVLDEQRELLYAAIDAGKAVVAAKEAPTVAAVAVPA